MILQTEQCVLVSASDNRYWASFFPTWGALATFVAIENPPAVIEPHYHDNDEFWLWIRGEGKARLDGGAEGPFEPGTVVFCPMGAVHEFVSPTTQLNIGITTHLVGRKRPLHLHVPQDGMPVRTGDGFILPGSQNVGPLQVGRPRCPLSELRLMETAPERCLAQGVAVANEYWLLIAGQLRLRLPELDVQLSAGDLGIVRKGVKRTLSAAQGGQVAVARE